LNTNQNPGHALGCRHLLSQCQDSIEIQTYVAIIACLLMALWAGRTPTLCAHRLLQWRFSGWADEGELPAHHDLTLTIPSRHKLSSKQN
jgi:hypothetical protein